MQTPQDTTAQTPHDNPPHDRPRHAADLIGPRELYIGLYENNRPAMIGPQQGYPPSFDKFIDEYQSYTGIASNDLMLHYRLPEGMRIPDWRPYWNGQDFGDYLHALLPLLHERGVHPAHQIRAYDAFFCWNKKLDPTAPENARERLLLRNDYYSYLGRKRLPYIADNRNLHRGIETQRGLLLFRTGPEGERRLRGCLTYMADNFFHPQAPGGTLRLTEAVPLEGARIPLPGIPAVGPERESVHEESLPQIDPQYYADPACLIALQTTASYDLAPTGMNYLCLCDSDRGERIVPAPDNATIALLDCLHRSAAVPEGAERIFLHLFRFSGLFEEPLGDLRALDPDSHRASELRAAISERAGTLLEEHYPLRRREQEPGQEQAHNREQEQTRSKGLTL